jgi:hypothetical protein
VGVPHNPRLHRAQLVFCSPRRGTKVNASVCFFPSGAPVASAGGAASARWLFAQRSLLSFFRCFSSLAGSISSVIGLKCQ